MNLSVIIPVYNVAPYLRRCLNSVISAINLLGQQKGIEVICVDDGSTDESSAILMEYGVSDSRFIIIKQNNQGLSAARNVGLDHSSGEWVAFIDSDDWVSKEYFVKLFDAVCRTGFDIAAVDTCDCDAETYWCKGGDSPAVAWGKLYRSSLWESVSFPVGRLHEDEYTTHIVVFKSGNVAGVRRKLYHYTFRNDSIMRDMSEKSIHDWIAGCSQQAEYLRGISDEAYGVALAKKIQAEHWLGVVQSEDIAEYSRAMRNKLGQFYWAEHYRHPLLVNRLTWWIIKMYRLLRFR